MKRSTSNRLKRKELVLNNILRFHIFDDYGCRELEDMCHRIEKYSGAIKSYIFILENTHNIHYRHSKKWHRKMGIKNTPDRRTGEETYGYESIESIEGNLGYISDRFASEFRLRWMLDVPKNVEKLIL